MLESQFIVVDGDVFDAEGNEIGKITSVKADCSTVPAFDTQGRLIGHHKGAHRTTIQIDLWREPKGKLTATPQPDGPVTPARIQGSLKRAIEILNED